jgi:ribosome-associated protein
VPPAKGTQPHQPAAPELVPVRLPITLGQFLKVANLASSGGEAKMAIAFGSVRVNGEKEQRRGRKLVPGDVVQVGGEAAQVASAGPTAETPSNRPGAPCSSAD